MTIPSDSLDRPAGGTCPLDVATFAARAVGRVREAASSLAAARGLDLRVGTSPELIAASFVSYENLRVEGEASTAWAELSGFLPAADGWVRLHGNYPHHARVLRELYGIRDRTGLEHALDRRSAESIEEEVTAAGGVAVRVRDRADWLAHPQARARAGLPWAEVEERGEREELPPLGPSARPLEGVRVLDLTRVIAGPTCSQLLATLGADVLRIDPPHLPEIPAQHLSTGMGKRSALLDLRHLAGRERFRSLAAGADVLLTGYRPGALARQGAGADDLAALASHAVIGVLSAWGETGPWADRRGFDSIVQATTGIAALCGDGERPGALPVQALDHVSGHLLAALVLESLAAARARTVRVSLLGAAEELLALSSAGDGADVAAGPAGLSGRAARSVPRVRVLCGDQNLEAVPPPLLLDGRTLELPVGVYGAAPARWR